MHFITDRIGDGIVSVDGFDVRILDSGFNLDWGSVLTAWSTSVRELPPGMARWTIKSAPSISTSPRALFELGIRCVSSRCTINRFIPSNVSFFRQGRDCICRMTSGSQFWLRLIPFAAVMSKQLHHILSESACRGRLKHQGKSGEIPALSRNGYSPSACPQVICINNPSQQRVGQRPADSHFCLSVVQIQGGHFYFGAVRFTPAASRRVSTSVGVGRLDRLLASFGLIADEIKQLWEDDGHRNTL